MANPFSSDSSDAGYRPNAKGLPACFPRLVSGTGRTRSAIHCSGQIRTPRTDLDLPVHTKGKSRKKPRQYVAPVKSLDIEVVSKACQTAHPSNAWLAVRLVCNVAGWRWMPGRREGCVVPSAKDLLWALGRIRDGKLQRSGAASRAVESLVGAGLLIKTGGALSVGPKAAWLQASSSA